MQIHAQSSSPDLAVTILPLACSKHSSLIAHLDKSTF